MTSEGISGKYWPAHLKPLNDELLSSWIVRLSSANGIKLHTFCNLAFSRKEIWNRDIDVSANDSILNTLAIKTGTNYSTTFNTTMKSFEGKVFEKCSAAMHNSWVNQIGVYHRIRFQFGLQYCPQCLREDNILYFRKKWRLSFITICEKHQVELRDCCMKCGAPITLHRDEMGIRNKMATEILSICFRCRNDYRFDKKQLSCSNEEVIFQNALYDASLSGWIDLKAIDQMYSVLFFKALHQLVKLLTTKRLENRIKKNACILANIKYTPLYYDNSHLTFESLRVNERRKTLQIAAALIKDWPDTFISFFQKNRIWSSNLLKDMHNPPYWYYKEIYDSLYKKAYIPSPDEIINCIDLFRNKNWQLSGKKISHFLGVSDVFKFNPEINELLQKQYRALKGSSNQ